jgi:hypothetical protein
MICFLVALALFSVSAWLIFNAGRDYEKMSTQRNFEALDPFSIRDRKEYVAAIQAEVPWATMPVNTWYN